MRTTSFAVFVACFVGSAFAQPPDKWETPAALKNLKYRSIGPSVGGVLYLLGPYVVYGTCVLTILSAAGASFLLPKPPDPAGPSKFSLGTLLATMFSH